MTDDFVALENERLTDGEYYISSIQVTDEQYNYKMNEEDGSGGVEEDKNYGMNGHRDYHRISARNSW